MIASVAPRHSSHKARYIYVEVVGVRKTTIRTLPVETIESMKHRKDNRGAQGRTHAKGYIVDG
jgi:hypothetical protein